MSDFRIGFCCKWVTPDGSDDKALVESMNQKSTTLTYLRKLSNKDQLTKLSGLCKHNVETLWRQLAWIAEKPLQMRLFRITSDFLPAYTADEFSHHYTNAALIAYLENQLAGVRLFAEHHQIRLVSHPGQFTNICSTDMNVVAKAIEDLEYHAYLAELMDFGDTWHSNGYAINIHANSRQDPGLVQFRDIVNNRVSERVRNLITLENDEYSCSVDDIVASGIGEDVALVLDIHHHWVQSKGEYIQPDDPRIQTYKDSWRRMRPLGHFSTSPEGTGCGGQASVLPDYKALIAGGLSSKDLRAHSANCWHPAVNDWALSHLSWMDIEVEAKDKNSASSRLYLQAVSKGMV